MFLTLLNIYRISCHYQVSITYSIMYDVRLLSYNRHNMQHFVRHATSLTKLQHGLHSIEALLIKNRRKNDVEIVDTAKEK